MSRNPFALLRSSIARHGLWTTLKLIPRNLIEVLGRRQHHTDPEFDQEFGTDTSGNVGLGGLTLEGADASASNQYQPVFRKRFDEVLGALPIAHEAFVFIDLGSGKGKALLLASDFPFKRVIGVEFARELHETALRNIAIYRGGRHRSADVASVCMDATRYQFPPGPVYVFLYNPFGPPLLGPVLDNLRKSLELDPRPAVLAYVGPVYADFLESRMAGLLSRRVARDDLLILTSPDVPA